MAEYTSLVHLKDALFDGLDGTVKSVIRGEIRIQTQTLKSLLEPRHQPYLVVHVGLFLVSGHFVLF